MKENTSKNVRNAHLLLAAYWGYRVLTGKSIPKTTIEVFRMERAAVLKQKREAELAEQKDLQIEVAGKKRKPASAALHGIAEKPLFRKAGKKILRNARVI